MDIDLSNPKWTLELSPKRIKKYSEEEIIRVITRIPFAVKFITDPKLEWLEFAALLNYQVMILIEDPSIDLQKKVLAKNPEAIAIINNLDETLALEMLTANPKLIDLIKSPTSVMLSVAKIIS